MVIKFKKINKTAIKPIRLTADSAGYDLCSNENKVIPPANSIANNRIKIGHGSISTGIILEIPIGYVGRIGSRSGLSVKKNIEVGAGWIDPDFRGEIIVELKNFGLNPFKVKKGDRIAQLFILKTYNCTFVESPKLSITKRNKSGFGSTGKN